MAAVSVTTTDPAVGAAWQGRLEALADHSLGGRAFCRRLAAATDVWIDALATNAREQYPRAPRFALLAVGGFGRGELSPQSDLDLLLVHDSKPARVQEVASAIWYPVWDAGLKLGHAVRSVDEQIELAKHDLDTATALLTARHIAGDPKLSGQVIEHGLTSWRKRSKQWLELLQQRVRERQATAGEVAYILEPDVKDGHGGIRDVQSLWWAECGGLALSGEDDAALNECYDVLLDARVALHRATGRPGDTLRLEDQDAAARAAGAGSADALMAAIAGAARTVAWIADEAWGRVARATGGTPREVAPGVVLLDGEIELADDVSIGPHCVIRGRVRIGAGTQLLGHVYLQGPLELGARNRLWPFAARGSRSATTIRSANRSRSRARHRTIVPRGSATAPTGWRTATPGTTARSATAA